MATGEYETELEIEPPTDSDEDYQYLPIQISFTYEAAGGDGWNEPRYGAQLVDVEVTRADKDKTPLTEAERAVFDAWWKHCGEEAALIAHEESFAPDPDYEYERRRDDRMMELDR